ncbi:hypothetical protein [Brachybacterium sp. UNK5269]|uniref:hypothetical protein n=1 Tax=Brachybacterium sp. UNK5269 TaxID=3408576 RepID=UPI003BB209F8
MLHRKHAGSDPFPSQCEVRGCAAPPHDWFAVEDATFDVCSAHELELRAGEPYLLLGGEILVGQDSTGEVVGVHRERTPYAEAAVIRLGRRGVAHQEVRLDSSADLRSALDALDADLRPDREGRDRKGR